MNGQGPSGCSSECLTAFLDLNCPTPDFHQTSLVSHLMHLYIRSYDLIDSRASVDSVFVQDETSS